MLGSSKPGMKIGKFGGSPQENSLILYNRMGTIAWTTDMKKLSLTDFTGDWQAVVGEVQRTGEPIALELDGTLCGLLLPTQEALRLAARHAPPPSISMSEVTASPDVLRTY